ncbi:MAG: glycosyltransferase [Prolixibacteraceae bacterium]|nr:glycosyltransferase [Prolixibacteraceae bacterium]
MKVLILGPANPYRGGIAALNERLAIQLKQEGHEVEIINFTLQYPKFLFPGKSQFTSDKPPAGLKITRMINSINPLNWIRTGHKLLKKKADMVVVRFWLPLMGPSTGTVCKILRKNKQTKIIAIVDNLIPHEKRMGDKLLTRYFINQTDALVALSECVYNDLDLFRKKQPKKLTPHPVYDHYGEIISREDALKKLGLDDKTGYILFFGFIRDYKGLDILIEAMASELLKNINVKLIVAGEFYANKEKYTSLIEEKGLQNRIILHTNYISEKEVGYYFCASNIIAQPYKTATQSGVTQIGYHFNKPMLVSNVGGLPEIIEHQKCGYVVEPKPDAIAEALHDYFTHNREAYMVSEVKKAKEKFSWNNLTNVLFELHKICS